jgi:hydroxymethylbilane synthase
MDLRGNLNTRLEKLESGLFDALVLAWAGMKRLGLINQISEVIHPDLCLPAVGQGAIGIEIKAGDSLLQEIAAVMDNQESRQAITAERAFLGELEGGCRVPVGALGTASMGRILLEGVVAGPAGSKLLRASVIGKTDEAEEVGKQLAARMIEMGAAELLNEVRRESGYDA